MAWVGLPPPEKVGMRHPPLVPLPTTYQLPTSVSAKSGVVETALQQLLDSCCLQMV